MNHNRSKHIVRKRIEANSVELTKKPTLGIFQRERRTEKKKCNLEIRVYLWTLEILLKTFPTVRRERQRDLAISTLVT